MLRSFPYDNTVSKLSTYNSVLGCLLPISLSYHRHIFRSKYKLNNAIGVYVYFITVVVEYVQKSCIDLRQTCVYFAWQLQVIYHNF